MTMSTPTSPSQEGDKQQAQVEHLNSFYNFVPDVKAQGQVRNPSTLLYSQLITVEGKIATYKVKYKGNDPTWQRHRGKRTGHGV